MNTTTLNGIEIPHTPENIEKFKKAIEEFESDDIKHLDEYWWANTSGNVLTSIWQDSKVDNYRKSQDNCCPEKNYTYNRAIEYFNKRDARRAAEIKLRKIIADMNKKDGFVARFGLGQDNFYSKYNHNDRAYSWSGDSFAQSLHTWRYSSQATAEFINENHADLLDIYLERK